MKPLLFILTILLSININAQNIVGSWNGKLMLPTTKLSIVFNIKKADNVLSATMDSPDQKAFGIPVDKVSFTDNKLEITVSNLGVVYKGTLVDDTNITGEFTQMGQKFDLNLTKGSVKAEIPNRPQEPTVPYNYNAEEISFKNEKDNIELAGTFTFPKSGTKFPAVILISGSGPQNRNEEIMGHKPFLVLSDYLTKQGIAVLRFDDRGTGKSEGSFDGSTTYDFANDVEAALNYLKTREEVDVKNVGVIGHSEGGIIAPMLASENKDVNFIVLMAAPALRGDKLLLLQKKRIEEKMGASPFVIESNQKIFRGAYDIILADNSTSLTDSLTTYFKSQYKGAMPEKTLKGMASMLASPWFVECIKLDPAVYLEKISCKVLALNGTKDVQVPAKENLELIQAILEKNKNKAFVVKELEGLNHLFQECETGLMNEYAEIEQTISPKALQEISDWILAN